MIYAGLPFLPTLLQLIGLSVLFAWLYIKTGGNILLTSLFHAAQSFFVIINEGIPATKLVWLMAAVYMAVAFILVTVDRSSFARKPIMGNLQVLEAAYTSHPSVRK
jgi:hypothetical protein